MNATCRQVQDRLLEMQFLKIAVEQDPAVVAHLEQCPVCRRYLNVAIRDHEHLIQHAAGLDQFVTDFKARVAGAVERASAPMTRLRTWVRVAAVILLGVGMGLAGLRLMRARHDIRAGAGPVQSSDPAQARLDEERRLAWLLRAAADVKGLIHLLETGLSPSQVLAAEYLADLRGLEAVPMLGRLAAAWTGDADTNPFAQALERLSVAQPNSEPSDAPLPEPPPVCRSIDIEVTDQETGLPIPGACVRAWGDHGQDSTCDGNGWGRVELAQTLPESLELRALAPGYVTMCSYLADVNEEDVGAQFHFGLERGMTIGGLVQDETGVPVQGATVYIYYHAEHGPKPYVYVLFEGPTDPEGQWSCDTIPRDLERRAEGGGFTFQVKHGDYATYYGVFDSSTIKDLARQAHCMVLYEGSALSGRVCGAQGEPIEGARVSAPGKTPCITAPDGTFVLTRIHPGERTVPLEIQAKGYASTEQWIGYSPDMAPVEIRLTPGAVPCGQVTDAKGWPVSDAQVSIVTRIKTGWSGRTDAEGGFAADPLSADRVYVSVDKEGFARIDRWMDLSPEPLRLVLHRSVHVTGRVVDAITAGPIDRFAVRTYEVSAEDGRVCWTSETCQGRAGRYEYTLRDASETGYAIVAEAEGYLPAQSRTIDPNEEEAVVDLALTPGTGPSGWVVAANGVGVANATVYAVRRLGGVSMENGVVAAGNPQVQTDLTGWFSMQPLFDQSRLVVVADQGICGVTVESFARSRRLVLRPWARVEGQLSISGVPVPTWPLEFRSQPESMAVVGYDFCWRAQTDDRGCFQVSRVPPGPITLLNRTYRITPGEVLRLDLTGLGSTVKGLVQIPYGVDLPQIEIAALAPSQSWQELPKPADVDLRSIQAVNRWCYDAISMDMHPDHERVVEWSRCNLDFTYAVALDASGGFQAPHVVPGHYVLRASAVRIWHVFDVPEGPDATVDLGTIQCPGPLCPGDAAPDIDVPRYGGGRIRLRDLRGQVVLLTFHDPEREDQAAFEIHKDLRAHPGLRVVGLRVVPSRGLKERLFRSKRDWPEGLVGRNGREWTLYGCPDPPWNILVDRDGTVLGTGLAGRELHAAVDQALHTLH